MVKVNMKKVFKIIITLVIVCIISVAAFQIIKNSNNKGSYDNFMAVAADYQNSFNLTNYNKISPEDGLTNNIKAFPADLLLEKRLNDGVNGDTTKPSKYEFYFRKDDQSTLSVITLVFFKNNSSGIIYETIISPDDNQYIDGAYKEIDRPYIVDKLVGCNNYSINMKTILLKPKSDISKSENIINLLNEDENIYREVEKFVTTLYIKGE